MTPSSVVKLISKAALAKKAREILVLDLSQLSELTNFFLICSGDSDIQVRAIADEILETLREKEVKEWHMEGYEHGRWVLIDYVEVVAHVFLEEAREYYRLEDLWGDAPTERVGEDEDTQG